MKQKLRSAAGVLVCYGILYGLCYRFFWIGRPLHLYTPDWIARHFLWLAAAVSAVAAFTGRKHLAFLPFGGLIAGMVIGELAGGAQSHLPPRYLHHGWWICILVWLLSAVIALLLDHRGRLRGK